MCMFLCEITNKIKNTLFFIYVLDNKAVSKNKCCVYLVKTTPIQNTTLLLQLSLPTRI